MTDKEQQIRGFAAQADDRYIVVLDAQDLSDWLKSDYHPGLTPVEKAIAAEIAEHIDLFALQVLNQELDQAVANGILDS